jgi:CHAT domain-containing protein
LLTGSRAQHARGTSYLLVADPSPMPSIGATAGPLPAGGTRAGAASLPPLPASRREVSGIRTVLGGTGTVLTGAAARESEIRRRAPDARVLHFATHGVLRDDEPFDSFLAVGAEGDGPALDGRLTVRELYDLRLSADLVVLSACRTATGPVSGEGIAGLSRAFFYAGTPTVVATLWDVADDPSATLMSTFYRQWKAGADKRAALRRAQLDLIRQLRSGAVRVKAPGGAVIPLQEHPFYWAAYILVGEK